MKRRGRDRLRAQSDFTYLFRTGRRVHTPFFSFIISKGERERTRIACIVAKRTAKSAVVRNRIRRRVNEWFRTSEGALRKPADIAIVVKPEAVGASRKRFYEELEKGADAINR